MRTFLYLSIPVVSFPNERARLHHGGVHVPVKRDLVIVLVRVGFHVLEGALLLHPPKLRRGQLHVVEFCELLHRAHQVLFGVCVVKQKHVGLVPQRPPLPHVVKVQPGQVAPRKDVLEDAVHELFVVGCHRAFLAVVVRGRREPAPRFPELLGVAVEEGHHGGDHVQTVSRHAKELHLGEGLDREVASAFLGRVVALQHTERVLWVVPEIRVRSICALGNLG
mmetsp:Transcript_38580/g.65688  ORF Transcript_38580/g.65688 Transcript_38580/m.65688 type:complete len:222 (+) Transcript_38580:588-1253(+)